LDIILEYCGDGTISTMISKSSMSEVVAAGWAHQMLQAIAFLHAKGICHRDVKPDNLLVTNRSILKLSDFGLACRCSAIELLTSTAGSIPFWAPEQVALERAARVTPGMGYGHPNDVWASGVVLAMMLCAEWHPFYTSGDSKEVVKDKIADGHVIAPVAASFPCTALLQRLCCRSPTERITAAAAVRNQWLADGNIEKLQVVYKERVVYHEKVQDAAESFEIGVQDASRAKIQEAKNPKRVAKKMRRKAADAVKASAGNIPEAMCIDHEATTPKSLPKDRFAAARKAIAEKCGIKRCRILAYLAAHPETGPSAVAAALGIDRSDKMLRALLKNHSGVAHAGLASEQERCVRGELAKRHRITEMQVVDIWLVCPTKRRRHDTC
jgi:hypothetical protein